MTNINKRFSLFARLQRSEAGRKAKNAIFFLLLISSIPAYSASCIWSYKPGIGLWQCPTTQGQQTVCYWAAQSDVTTQGPPVCRKPDDYQDSDYDDFGYPKNPNGGSPDPIDTNPLVAAAAAVALGLLAGIGAIVGAPLLVTSGLAAAAIGALIAASPLVNSPTPQLSQVPPPLQVNLTPSTQPVPSPVVNDSRPPGVQVNAENQYAPTGPKYQDAQSGGWQSNNTPTGTEYAYHPPATTSNPQPEPTMIISNNGYSISYTGTNPSNGKSGVVIDHYTDGSYTVTESRTLPVTTISGEQTTVDSVKTVLYSSNGAKLGESTYVKSMLGNGQTANPDTLDFGDGGDTGGDSGGGDGGDNGTGGCTGGDCATETTQLANKNLLQQIKDSLTQSGTPSTVPNAKTTNEFKDASLTRDSSVFSGILGFQLPAHNSTCPQPSFDYNGQTYAFEAHCNLVTDHFDAFRAVFTVIFTLSALFIVLRA